MKSETKPPPLPRLDLLVKVVIQEASHDQKSGPEGNALHMDVVSSLRFILSPWIFKHFLWTVSLILGCNWQLWDEK